MNAEYKISSDAPYSIIIEGEGALEPFVEIMGGTKIETMDGDIVEIPFTHENALRLRNYLKGRDVEIPPREKAILSYLADNPKALEDNNLIWSTQLTALISQPAPGRFMKIKNGWDLIHYMPLRYLDKTNPQAISELVVGEWGVIIGTVAVTPEYNQKSDFVKIVVADVHGSRIAATFFRQKWLQWVFKEGDEVVLYGNYSEFVNRNQQRFPQLTNPKIDKMGTLRGELAMVPIYPQRKADKSLQLQKAQKELIDNIVWIEDPVPTTILKKYNLVSRNEAYKKVHFPATRQDVEEARTRIAFDEFVRLQVFLTKNREEVEAKNSSVKTATNWADRFVEALPFDLTPGQLKVIEEIRVDMSEPSPMYRLLQGDVGSGKAQPLHSKILTPTGFTTMKDIKVNHIVLTPNGGQAKVIGVYPQGERKVYKLTFEDGSIVEGDENHLWNVTNSTGAVFNKTTLELLETLTTENKPDVPQWFVKNPTINGLGSSWNETVDPYVWVSETFDSNPSSIELKIFTVNETARKIMLQSILDKHHYEPDMTTFNVEGLNKTQMETFISLAKSVGASIKTQTVFYEEDNLTQIWNVSGQLRNPPYNAIVNISFVNEQETQCIKVNTEEGLYITDNFITTHNTEISSVATLVAAEEGYQTALLAPTDILASQLKERLTRTFKNAGISEEELTVELINGKTLGKKRKALLDRLANNEISVLVGTHALISDDVKFGKLGLVVIDEQHKFGSEQRSKLKSKTSNGESPDFLMMSATPIPRTVSQVVYGDMDISIVEGIPSERKPIQTFWDETPDSAWVRIREQVEQGQQAYVVAALVEESDKVENVEAAETTYLTLANKIFPDFNVGLMHGRLKPQEKEDVINSFLKGDVQILVATSVVEVGVNVPNATVMTILNANRFGISSLHQIRGRVGRGSIESYCYLIGKATTPEAEERLAALVQSTDGFWLSEKDLEIRGEGSLFGQLQSGANDMFIGNLKEHREMLDVAKKVAKQASSSIMLNKEVKLLYTGKTISA